MGQPVLNGRGPTIGSAVIRGLPSDFNDSTPQHELGSILWDAFGRKYQYIQAASAIAEGDAIVQAITDSVANESVSLTGGSVAAGVNTATTPLTVDLYGSALPTILTDVLNGWFLYDNTDAVAAEGDIYRIVKFTKTGAAAGTLILDRVLDNQITEDDNLTAFNPWRGKPCGAVNQRVRGIGIGTIGSANYGFIQTTGFCPQAKYLHTANSVTLPTLARVSASVSGLLVTTATAGTLSPQAADAFSTSTKVTDAELDAILYGLGQVRPACIIHSQASAAAIKIPVFLNCEGLGG